MVSPSLRSSGWGHLREPDAQPLEVERAGKQGQRPPPPPPNFLSPRILDLPSFPSPQPAPALQPCSRGPTDSGSPPRIPPRCCSITAQLPSTAPAQEPSGSCQSSRVTNPGTKKWGKNDGGSNDVSDWRWLITGGRFAVLSLPPLLAAKLTKPQRETAGMAVIKSHESRRLKAHPFSLTAFRRVK